MNLDEQIKTVALWVKDLSIALGVELSLDEDGVCFFQIGESTVIGIEVSPDLPMVHLFSPLMPLPADNKEFSMLMALRALELNAFQTLTRGGSIAIVPGGGPLIFCYSTPIEGVDSEIFGKILGGFYETIPEIKRMLSESDVEGSPLAPPVISSSLMMNKGFIKI